MMLQMAQPLVRCMDVVGNDFGKKVKFDAAAARALSIESYPELKEPQRTRSTYSRVAEDMAVERTGW
jgi:hypothetical protein|eukprot:6686562-Prymnesium_polylepis.1